MAAVHRWRHWILLLSYTALLGDGILVLEGVIRELRSVMTRGVTVTWSRIESHSTITLIPARCLRVDTVIEVTPVAEHPGLARRRLGRCWSPERSVATSARRAGELPGEVDGKGAEAVVIVRFRGAPARLLLNEGRVGDRSAVGRARVKVQHGSPLRSAAARHSAAPVTRSHRGHGRQ